MYRSGREALAPPSWDRIPPRRKGSLRLPPASAAPVCRRRGSLQLSRAAAVDAGAYCWANFAKFQLSRIAPLTLLVLGLLLAKADSVARAATLIPMDSTETRWRAVNLASPTTSSSLVTLEGNAPPHSSLIPVDSGRPPGLLAAEGLTEDLLPADAQVAAAPIRPPYMIRPSLNGGVPTGFVGGWGDYFFSGSAGTPGNLRDGSPDGSLNLGFGVGDPDRLLGAEVFWGIGSIKNLNANGGFGAAVGRNLVNRPDLQVGIAGGVIDAFSYGSEGNPQPINGYGAVSAALPLRPSDATFPQMVQFTLGGGGSSFSAIDTTFQAAENGFYGAAGVELTPNVGVSLGVSGRGTNINVSWVPFRSLPVFVNVLAADVFDATPWGTIGVLSVGWGDNLQTGFVAK